MVVSRPTLRISKKGDLSPISAPAPGVTSVVCRAALQYGVHRSHSGLCRASPFPAGNLDHARHDQGRTRTCIDAGWAHSIEVWQDETLIGGLYGLVIGRVAVRRVHVQQTLKCLENRVVDAGSDAGRRHTRDHRLPGAIESPPLNGRLGDPAYPVRWDCSTICVTRLKRLKTGRSALYQPANYCRTEPLWSLRIAIPGPFLHNSPAF